MAINKGNIKTSVNYNLEAQKPLDARAERPTKADLHKKESWSSDGDTIYIHEGQITYTEQEKKLFLLKDVKNFESEEAWAQILTTDDEIQGGGSDITVDSAMSESSTNPVQNRVVKKYVDEHSNVYVGTKKPTDEKYDIWINPIEEPDVVIEGDGVIVVDGAMSDESSNAVQNMVIKAYVDYMDEEIEEVSSAAMNKLNDSVNELGYSLSKCATKEDLKEANSNISNDVISDEEVAASALTYLESAIKDIMRRLEILENK